MTTCKILNLLIILHQFHVLYLTRNECRAKSIHLRPTYLHYDNLCIYIYSHNIIHPSNKIGQGQGICHVRC